MKQKTFAMVCVALLTLCTMAGTWKDPATGITWTYWTSWSAGVEVAQVKGCSPAEGTISIPSSLDGKSVVSVLDHAFSGNDKLTRVEIPSGVLTIENYAFSECTKMTSVVIPPSVTRIGEYAFFRCRSLSGVTIPTSVIDVLDDAFGQCESLTSVTISDGVTNIYSGVFCGCVKLTSILIPASVNYVGDAQFLGCDNLREITVSPLNTKYFSQGGVLFYKNVKHEVYLSEFPRGKQTTSYSIPSGVNYIGSRAFEGSSLTCVTIPFGVEGIGERAFYGCSDLTDVVIPSSVTLIGDAAFCGSGLTNITIPSSVTDVGDSAFNSYPLLALDFEGAPPYGIEESVINHADTAIRYNGMYYDDWKAVVNQCEWTNAKPYSPSPFPAGGPYKEEVNGIVWTFTVDAELNASVGSGEYDGERAVMEGTRGAIVIPASLGQRTVTSVGAYAFWGRGGLTSVTVPPGVTRIQDSAFRECIGLTDIAIPLGVTRIGSEAFQGCSLLSSILLNEGLAVIGYHAFMGCSSLRTVNIPNSVEYVGSGAFAGTQYWEDQSDGMIVLDGCALGIKGDSTTQLVVPEGVRMVAAYAFDSNTATSLSLPSSLRVICPGAFARIKAQNDIVIPNGVATVGSQAFFNSCIASVTIPSTVTGIESQAFKFCSSLTAVHLSEGLECIADEAFSGCTKISNLSMPDSVVSIGDGAFSDCTGLLTTEIGTGIESIGVHAFEGCTELRSFGMYGAPTNLGAYAFGGSARKYENLEAIKIKDLKKWCENNFTYTAPLLYWSTSWKRGSFSKLLLNDEPIPNDLAVPIGVPRIGARTFEYLPLKSVSLPSTVISIGDLAFSECGLLTNVNLNVGLKSIEYGAFYNCTGIQSVTIPSSVTNIGVDAFCGCSGLTSVTIPPSVTSIGISAFHGCWGLKCVEILTGVREIGRGAFYRCTGLKSVTIPESVTNIEQSSFYGCISLVGVTIPSSVTSIGKGAFGDCNSLTSVDFEGAPPTGVGGAGFCTDATIRYNIGYEAEWLPVIEACGWTNAKAYTPIKITNVTAQQRYPWNGKVDITFAVENAGSEACELFIRATDMTTGKTTVASNVSGDAECTSGLHHVVWDMVADGLTLVSSNVVFSVSYKEQKRPDGLYCVIDLSGGSSATTYPITDLDDVPFGGWGDEYKTTKLVLRRIDPGTCVVTVDKPYYVGVFEVTQKQYELVTGETPSRFSGDVKRPVEYVSYDMIRGSNKGAQYPDSTDVDADSFMGKLRSRTGLHVDLPTEAQWEYAGRAGAMTGYYFGDFANGDYMWYSSNSGSCPHEVGTRKPNAWGLYDVHGNVFERCLEWHSAGLRVLRGGGWFDGDGGCSFYYRAGFDPSDPNDNIGFRLVSTTAEASIAATTATLGISDPVRIDLTEGTRTAAATEIITYSTEWGDCASADAVAVVSVDGAVVSEASGRGTIEWRPTSGGIHTLTHKMMSGQTQLGEMLTATFVVVVPVKPGEEIVVQEGKAEAKATEINSDPGVKAQYLKAPEGVETTAEYLSYFKAVATSGSTVGFVLNEQGTNEVMNATVAVKTTTLDVVLSADSTVVIDKPLAGFYYSLKQGGDVSVGDRADLNKLGGRDLISFELTKEPLRYFYKTLVTPTPVPAE